MSDSRSKHWLIELRFFLLCTPVGVILAILFLPWAVPVLFSFFGTLFLFWHGSRLFTNWFVWFFDPEGYRAIKQNGGDLFYDSLGSPLNNDSEQVRMFGHEANATCPSCGQPVFIQADVSSQCPNCNAYWQQNQWWR